MKKLILLVVTLFVSGQLFAQTLWQNVEYGMSLEQVKGLYPAAAEIGSTWYVDGYRERLTMGEYVIVNNEFTVFFVFKNNHLIQVELTWNNEKKIYDAQFVFNDLVQALTVRYGAPLDTKKVGRILSNDWFSNGVNISLSLYNINDESNLRIVYQVRLAKEADKL